MMRIDRLPALPDRPVDAHKGTFGRVLVIAGSRGMSGAACLCGTAALRSGSGLVYVATPASTQPVVAAFEPSYLTVELPEDENGKMCDSALATIWQHARGMNAVAIGPGLGQSPRLRLLVAELFCNLEKPLVVDADALNLLARSRDTLGRHAGPRILTPHPGEFARLAELSIPEIQTHRQSRAGDFAARHGVLVVLKGAQTVITDGAKVALNTTGNAGMATGGTGDVLTGVIVSLLGQGMSAFHAAQLAVHVHGLAGDVASERYGERSMIASDLLTTLPEAWTTLAAESA